MVVASVSLGQDISPSNQNDLEIALEISLILEIKREE